MAKVVAGSMTMLTESTKRNCELVDELCTAACGMKTLFPISWPRCKARDAQEATIVALPPRPSTAVDTLSEQDHVLIVLAAALAFVGACSSLAHEVKVGRGVREAEWGQTRGEERLAVGA